MLSFWTIKSEKDSKEEILKAFKLFDDDDTVSILYSSNITFHD